MLHAFSWSVISSVVEESVAKEKRMKNKLVSVTNRWHWKGVGVGEEAEQAINK